MIQKTMLAMGIESRAGWRCEQTEAALIRSDPQIQRGEYCRINELMEKYFYGETALEPSEIRVLYYFLEKLQRKVRRTLIL